MEEFVVEQRPIEGADIVVLRGRLDAAVSTGLREELKRLVGEGRTRLVFDLGGLTFIDSTGLSVLIAVLKTATVAGGDLVLFELTAAVRSIVELSRLDCVFCICDSQEAALAQIHGAPGSP